MIQTAALKISNTCRVILANFSSKIDLISSILFCPPEHYFTLLGKTAINSNAIALSFRGQIVQNMGYLKLFKSEDKCPKNSSGTFDKNMYAPRQSTRKKQSSKRIENSTKYFRLLLDLASAFWKTKTRIYPTRAGGRNIASYGKQ